MQSKFLLFRSMLIVNFSKHTVRPFANAVSRLLVAFFIALSLGLITSSAIKHATLPNDLPPRLIMVIALALGYILGGFVMLAMGSSQTTQSRGTVFQRILKTLPLTRLTQWGIILAAPLLVLGVISTFGLSPIVTLSRIMNFNVYAGILSWSIGLLAGFGCLILHFPKTLALKGLLFAITVSIILVMFDKVLSIQNDHDLNLLLMTICGTILVQLVGFWQSYQHGIVLLQDKVNAEEKQLIPTVLPSNAWFLVKLWRNRRTRNSFYIVIVLSITSAISIVLRHKNFEDPYSILMFGAILSAMFACDVRGVMRRNIPPEMVLLKGTKGIVRAELVAVFWCSFIIGLPIFMAVHSMATNPLMFALFFLTVQLFSATAGLLASTLFVPGAGDTGAQFFSAALATITVLGLPKFGHFSDVSYDAQFSYWLMASIVLCVAVYVTELIRRRHYGRA